VLLGAHLDVAPGERVAIIGRSGAGKSTLLHVLGGLDHPDPAGGRIVQEGTDIYRLSARMRSAYRARNVGFVFQSYHLLPEMDIVENVMLPAFALGRPTAGAKRKARELLESVGLGDRLAHTPMELSGGEQQRVALARALMNDPRLILADEPTGNLDATTGGQVLDLLFHLSEGHALVLVTHSPNIAARCDRTLRLEDGLLVPA
jgi:lipoprotein-releasing system ATP-binding protein